MVRFEALQESHIYIKTSWMCPPLRWFQSRTHLELPLTAACQQGRGKEERRREVRGAERQGEEVREAGRQRDTMNVFDADELAYRIILCAKPAGNNSSCI